MKTNRLRLIYTAALALFLLVLAIFLHLSYKTMYKQNHIIPILEYHNLTSDPAMVNTWTITANDFDDQMSFLKQNFQVVSLKSLLESVRLGIPVPDHTVAVTFDDGYQSNFSLVYPIIQKYQIPVTFFVVTKYAQNGGGGGYQSMTWDELKTMASPGLIDIESHSYDLHRRAPGSQDGTRTPMVLAHINIGGNVETPEQYDQRIKSDLTRSRHDIETQLGIDSRILCWPFGAYDQHTNELARQAGFIYMIGATGYFNPLTDIKNVGRVLVTGGMGTDEFEKLVNPRKVNFWQAMILETERIKLRLNFAR
ncbi:MAG: polysaccharide deacetylase family protein [Syntrophomonadaceae bacterium]